MTYCPFGGLYLGKASNEGWGHLCLLRIEKLNSLVFILQKLENISYPTPHLSICEKALLVNSSSQILKNHLGK